MSPRASRTQRMSVSFKPIIQSQRSRQSKRTTAIVATAKKDTKRNVSFDPDTEYRVEFIQAGHMHKDTDAMWFYVFWTGYKNATWEPYENVKDCVALDDYFKRIAYYRKEIEMMNSNRKE